MASIFKKDDNYVDKPNRNTFDLSFQNNLSLKFGKLVPCFCQEVLPGDSFRIKPTFGLRFLPQVFPVQTRMRAHMHFFYVRNRTIWKDWMDFIGKTKDNLTLPYLVPNDSSTPTHGNTNGFSESSIFDYMGLPTSLDTSVGSRSLFSNAGQVKSVYISSNGITPRNIGEASILYKAGTLSDVTPDIKFSELEVANVSPHNCYYFEYGKPIQTNIKTTRLDLKFGLIHPDFYETDTRLYLVADVIPRGSDTSIKMLVSMTSLTAQSSGVIENGLKALAISDGIVSTIYGYVVVKVQPDTSIDSSIRNTFLFLEIFTDVNRGYPFNFMGNSSIPYGNGVNQYRISALPFRAYEAVYNSFYRNPENNPFLINGIPEYNRYVVSNEGGPQPETDFSLFNRNWEDDAFTTAVPSPQQGNAPRVGLTGNATDPVELRYMSDDGSIDGVLKLIADENGLVKMVASDNPADTPNNLVNALNDAVNFGITINDLRNVNALQLWLEKNVRKGYRYRDQLLSHYGVSVSYNDLMLPEFIGGVSRDVTVNQVTQTVETSTGNLGDMAGQAYVVGDGESVTKYCDEHGYIIGILSVVPVPNYSQMIPKHFFKHDAFDYFFPEFGKIGMQPITCKEIAATASWLTFRQDETFGYQRAWYDYLANVDQVHGKFNSEFYDFLIQRKFGNVPELGANFTTVKNEDLNNIFYVDDNEDKILGQIYFDVKSIREIPLYGIPSLE